MAEKDGWLNFDGEQWIKNDPSYVKVNKNGKVPIIHFFTLTEYRQKKLEELATKYDVFVKVYVIQEY
nr:hypothetical protein [Bacillus toyonensis]